MEEVDRMDDMLEAIQEEITKDPPTAEVKAFFKLVKVLEELLHEHTEVTDSRMSPDLPRGTG
jgi:hypothetical protein